MARFSIAFDNADHKLGFYFDLSKQDIIDYINQNGNGHQITEIPSDLCSQAYIDITLAIDNPDIFLFIAYSHGQKDRLLSTQGSYIQVNINSNRFVNSFFYSMACHTAVELGVDLFGKNCRCFIGYEDEAWILHNHIGISISCDNFGMKKFISGSTLKQSFDEMKQNFTSEIDTLEANGDALAASYLRLTRDALVMQTSNPDLTFGLF